MKLIKLFDGFSLKFAGFGLIKIRSPKYSWTPRYDHNGDIYMWLRNEEPIKEKAPKGLSLGS